MQVFNLIESLIFCPEPKVRILKGIGDALIDRSRGRVATKFLQYDSEQLWFIDDDIIIDPMDLTRMMWQMKKDNLDILGAPYILKSEDKQSFAVKPLTYDYEIAVGENAPIQEVRFISTGCMGIQKRVFEKMIEKEMVHLCHAGYGLFYPFFKPEEMFLDGKWIYLSEDWAFCKRASDLGFKIYCDFSVKTGHIGQKTYDWDDFFRETKKEILSFTYTREDLILPSEDEALARA